MSRLSLSEIRKHPAFIELLKKRHKLRVNMIGVMLLVFMNYMVSWAFFPQFINARFPDNSSVTVGIWFTVVVVLVAIILSAYYAMVAGKPLDKLNAQLLKDVGHDL
ncbi:MAG: uncharacterized membrane protein (DUF485 family) [Paraglaciecola sp.]|jgi:uncharacterized membrane protein (DUF485 family)